MKIKAQRPPGKFAENLRAVVTAEGRGKARGEGSRVSVGVASVVVQDGIVRFFTG